MTVIGDLIGQLATDIELVLRTDTGEEPGSIEKVPHVIFLGIYGFRNGNDIRPVYLYGQEDGNDVLYRGIMSREGSEVRTKLVHIGRTSVEEWMTGEYSPEDRERLIDSLLDKRICFDEDEAIAYAQALLEGRADYRDDGWRSPDKITEPQHAEFIRNVTKYFDRIL